MENIKPINFKEKKLLFAFAFLILLTLVIGLVSISQINGLSRKIEDLGKHSLRLEGAVLEMRISNTIYAMGVRNYVYWKSSRYLGALPMAVNINSILGAGDKFKKQLKIYQDSAYLAQQKDWANQITASFNELLALGAKIVELVDLGQSDKTSDTVNNLLMTFENRVYKIDEFLDSSMGKANLQEVERQMFLANADKEQAVLFLRLSLMAALLIGTLIAVSVYRRRIKEHSYRQQLFNRLINMEESERKKLSTAVHDEMGQDLSALKIYLGLISQELAGFPGTHCFKSNVSPEDLITKVEECKKIASTLIDKSHNIAFLLRPPDLDEVGLLESLESLLIETKQLTGVEYIFQKADNNFELPPEYSLLIYRIIQELLTNMAKHAKAKNVEVRLNRNKNSLELFYHDNGRGFDYQLVTQRLLRRREDKLRLGLVGLKERVEVLDGSMHIESGLGKGTTINVVLPI
ncbi:MAG: ATP-binding protein [Candidatus Omnitrophota bacterium]|nr:ATP-binding protein [Candidatus Omnitrophota bacterium]